MVLAFVVGFGVFAAVGYNTLATIRVNGPISMMLQVTKDILGDFVSPVECLVEPHMVDLQTLNAIGHGNVTPFLARGAQLRRDYEDAHKVWLEKNSERYVRELATDKSYRPAMAYFELREREFIPAVLAGDRERARKVLDGDMTKLFNEHKAVVDELAAYAVKKVPEVRAQADTLMHQRIWLAGVIGVVMLAATVAISALEARAITRPLARTVRVLEVVAAGDLTERLGIDSGDEIGRMGRSLDEALERMEETVRSIGESAVALTASSVQLEGLSHQMATGAEETASQAGVVSVASEQVNASVQQVAAAVEEMGSTIKEIARNANEAAQVAASAAKVAGDANESIAQLGRSGSEIGQVINVITSIAEQTNLLALNATIEAARAGEAGKGFAVVASEVKELSRATAKATDEIGQKIAAMQQATEASVAAIAKIVEVITRINESQTTIAGAVEEQTATSGEIARSITELSKASDEIARTITGVAEAARHTSDGVGEAQAAAAELSLMATLLKGLVEQFRYDGSDSGPPTTALGHRAPAPRPASARPHAAHPHARPSGPRPGQLPGPGSNGQAPGGPHAVAPR
jgi:methyl-accepting chemotaxis protein